MLWHSPHRDKILFIREVVDIEDDESTGNIGFY